MLDLQRHRMKVTFAKYVEGGTVQRQRDEAPFAEGAGKNGSEDPAEGGRRATTDRAMLAASSGINQGSSSRTRPQEGINMDNIFSKSSQNLE